MNVSVTFQQFINDIFSNLLDVCIIIYLDDILICSDDIASYKKHVKEVLKYLCNARLYAKAEKCEFHSKLVEYLGYNLSPTGLTIPIFTFNYPDIVISLIQLTRKDVSWNFDNFYCNTFNILKKVFTFTSILIH